MRSRRAIAALLGLCLVLFMYAAAFAASPTDEIRLYTVTADVNQDATVRLVYHIEWEVLESDGLGPVEWVTIGIPGNHVESTGGITDNIKSIGYEYGGGDYVRIDFNDKYYEGEIIVFEFEVVMDYMYEMNAREDGYTVYYFTPGWFDEIDVDELIIRWNHDKLVEWSGDCQISDGYNTWTTKLPMGETYGVQLTYPNDAFEFKEGGGWKEAPADDDWED
ncbi:MAG: hypothetical protein II689_01260, partial [Firmicutes bacterium]|nr:hypothetical protein [Bacillota bacterium]